MPQTELLSLVQATTHYLRGEWSDLEQPPVVAKAQPVVHPPPKPQAKPQPKPQPKPKPVEQTTNWPLTPMELPVEFCPKFEKLYKPLPLDVPIRLYVADDSQVLFLESLCRAITQHFGPASLFKGKLDTLLTTTTIELVLAPLSCLKKRFPQLELHHHIKLDGPTLLPLADEYDLDLKRELWTCLKNFRASPPSS